MYGLQPEDTENKYKWRTGIKGKYIFPYGPYSPRMTPQPKPVHVLRQYPRPSSPSGRDLHRIQMPNTQSPCNICNTVLPRLPWPVSRSFPHAFALWCHPRVLTLVYLIHLTVCSLTFTNTCGSLDSGWIWFFKINYHSLVLIFVFHIKLLYLLSAYDCFL